MRFQISFLSPFLNFFFDLIQNIRHHRNKRCALVADVRDLYLHSLTQ